MIQADICDEEATILAAHRCPWCGCDIVQDDDFVDEIDLSPAFNERMFEFTGFHCPKCQEQFIRFNANLDKYGVYDTSNPFVGAYMIVYPTKH